MNVKLLLLTLVTTATARNLPENDGSTTEAQTSVKQKDTVKGLHSSSTSDRHHEQGFNGKRDSLKQPFYHHHHKYDNNEGIMFNNESREINENNDKNLKRNTEKQDQVTDIKVVSRSELNTMSNDSDTSNKTIADDVQSTNDENTKKLPIDNEVTPGVHEGRATDNTEQNDGAFIVGDKWIWGDTSSIKPTTSPTVKAITDDGDLFDRAAFDGGMCPSGQVKPKGIDMCVDKDK